MSDLDILSHRHDLARARALIEDRGFRPLRLETHPGAVAQHENELPFMKPGRVPVELDVHWSLLDSPFYQRELAMEWFWDSARVQPLGGPSAPTRLAPPAIRSVSDSVSSPSRSAARQTVISPRLAGNISVADAAHRPILPQRITAWCRRWVGGEACGTDEGAG